MGDASRILVVDDDDDARYTLVRQLRRLGYARIEEARDGYEALRRIEAEPPDLVLLDTMMPGLDGAAVLRALHEADRLPDLPVVMVSANDSMDVVVRCIELGADDYLAKPVNVALLRARVASALEKRRHRESERAYLRRFDGETGLFNRSVLLERLQQALALRRRSALAAIVMDDHAQVMVSAGEAGVAKRLAGFAERINARLPGVDTLARVAPDALALILPVTEGEYSVAAALEALARGATAEARPAAPGRWSIGLAFARFGDDAPGADDLLGLAMSAAREVPVQARNRLSIVTPGMRESMRDALRLHAELERALSRDEFVLHFQPICAIDTLRPVAAEVLLRWAHPRHGLWTPGRFLYAVERSPLIQAIDEWVLEHTCRTLRAWKSWLPPVFALSANVTAETLAAEGLVGRIEAGLDEDCAGRLRMELTETMVMHDMPACVNAMEQLRARGVKIALDDFGTGFSSMTHISQIHCDALKIDRSFVSHVDQQPRTAKVLRAMVALAKSLDLVVIAEGVEREEELAVVRDVGCDLVQGYLTGRPMDADALRARLGG
ncbi:sensory box/GGDEF family protein [Mizugakiibacter sediminis]|uniref:Sensory box/GGDEF family protein n=2 Tax=Mizugakiibacter sediminis TaxID=1475481 RepID=A0A0K8QL97_9GAMM|nr:EAL domain-containing response regulator [Mizugakiibacter sediminis]GAP65202.1 sensory box/GGDEF family protein [Mizugakiibacter sediminis]